MNALTDGRKGRWIAGHVVSERARAAVASRSAPTAVRARTTTDPPSAQAESSPRYYKGNGRGWQAGTVVTVQLDGSTCRPPLASAGASAAADCAAARTASGASSPHTSMRLGQYSSTVQYSTVRPAPRPAPHPHMRLCVRVSTVVQYSIVQYGPHRVRRLIPTCGWVGARCGGGQSTAGPVSPRVVAASVVLKRLSVHKVRLRSSTPQEAVRENQWCAPICSHSP
jgi:hypothetical protein